MTTDWQQWHRHYDVPDSSLVQRLDAVRSEVRRAFAEAPYGDDGVMCVTSICAGESRDLLPALSERGASPPLRAVLVELDPVLAQRASATVAALGLSGVDIRMADAGVIDTYADIPPAHLLLACGIFGNISTDDVQRTIATLPALMAADGIVIWTRGAERPDRDHSQEIRGWFAEQGFAEMSFVSTEDRVFRVGMHRLAVEPPDHRTIQSGTRMFVFV